MKKKLGVAIITGGGGGIGEACVERLAAEGYVCVVIDSSDQAAKRVAKVHKAHSFNIDVSDEIALRLCANKVERDIGPVEVLVTCAAIVPKPTRALHETQNDWDRMIAVNLRGTYLSCIIFGEGMIRRENGAIVTIGSLAGMGVLPLNSYGMSKAAVIHMTKNLAVDWGRKGVRVNCVSPGPVRTPLIEASYERGERDPTKMENQTALGRLVMPIDIANVVAFLVSDGARAVTGVNLPVDAGCGPSSLSNLYGIPSNIFE
jgi:NAD(P)-dependent dehydrogenase (short-subunit alcohol dehydrogenase family)